jgi:dienelactone hydrolase
MEASPMMPPMHRSPRHTARLQPWLRIASLMLAAAAAAPSVAQEPPAADEQALETSDGVRFGAWYYAAPAETKPTATVILIHDIGGSHKSVGDLARALQRAGCAVVAPDLRGHGSGSQRSGEAAADAHQLLRKADFEAMAASDGRVRDDPASSHRGEIEAVRGWIKKQADAGKLDIDRLCVVGSGLGATLAAMWTAADWNWPPTTAGPQGQQVKALVLVSPAMAKRGLPMTGPLASEAIRFAVPVMVLAGTNDREASRFFDQLKRFRPKAWFQQRDGQPPEKARDLEDPSDATAFLIQCNTTLSGDKLATDTTVNVADKMKTFLGMMLDKKPRE